jgi:hypothetical protein
MLFSANRRQLHLESLTAGSKPGEEKGQTYGYALPSSLA